MLAVELVKMHIAVIQNIPLKIMTNKHVFYSFLVLDQNKGTDISRDADLSAEKN